MSAVSVSAVLVSAVLVSAVSVSAVVLWVSAVSVVSAVLVSAVSVSAVVLWVSVVSVVSAVSVVSVSVSAVVLWVSVVLWGGCGVLLEQAGSDSGVGRVRCGELCCGDEPGVGLGADVGLVAVAALRAGLAGVAGLGVHCRYDPARRHAARYAPATRHLGVGLDVLAGHHRQKRRRLGLLVADL